MYHDYLVWQHKSANDPIDETKYQEMFVDSCPGVETIELQLWAGDSLAGVGTLDRMGDALSSVYFYFDPQWARYSPGTFSALCELEFARAWGLRYYYLGYYIAACRQMNYKAKYMPHERKKPDDAAWDQFPGKGD